MDVTASRKRTSALLREVAEADGGDRISVGEIIAALRNRAYGLLLIVFGGPCLVPMPPPIPVLFGLGVSLLAGSMLAGRTAVWLPGFVTRRTLPRSALRRMILRILPTTVWVEKFCRPRLFAMTERPGKALFGVVLLVLGVIIILPIPVVGNIPPAFALVVTGIGLSERDGVVMGVGLFLSAIALAITSTAAWATFTALAWAF